MMAVQSAAARSVGVRPAPARNFALYDRASLTKLAAVTSEVCANQSAGTVDAGPAFVIAIAESRSCNAAATMAAEPENGGMTKLPVAGSIASCGVMIAAES